MADIETARIHRSCLNVRAAAKRERESRFSRKFAGSREPNSRVSAFLSQIPQRLHGSAFEGKT